MKKIATLVLTSMLAMTVASCTPSTPSTTAAGTSAGTTTAGTTTAGTTAAGTTAGVEDPAATITVQAEETWMEYYQAAVDSLKTKYPDSTVELVTTGSFDNLDAIDATDALNEAVPDVFAVPADRLPSMINKEALLPIPADEMATALGGYTDMGILDIMKDGEDYLAFPMNIETLIVFVNTANAEAANVDLTKPYEVSTQTGNELAVEAYNAWFGVAFANAVGLEFLAKDGDTFMSDMTKDWSELEADKQGVITELYNYWKRVYETDPALWDTATAGAEISEKFKDGGDVVFKIDGPWATPDLVKNIPSLDVMPLSQITVNGNPLKHWQGLWGIGVNSRIEGDDAKVTLATEFIKELLNPEKAEEFFKATGKIMPNVAAADYEASGLSDMEKKTIAAVIESFANAEKRPLFSEWGQVWTTWENGMLSWNASKPASAEEAYKALQESFTAMMGNIGQ